MDHIPLGAFTELFKAAHDMQTMQLFAQMLTPTVSPTVSPPCAPPSPASDVSSEASQEMITLATVPKKKKRRSPMSSPTKTYNDCEKKHFLDVAYENNWGTTVAANKFSRVWGKGPTRRMFYWWREQFKRDHDRDKRTLTSLTDRKTELSLELSSLCQNQENLLIPAIAQKAKQCLAQLEAIDSEIEIFHAKRLKLCCTITGEKCTHGDGIQESNPVGRKFITPFFCEHCNMPFQKETTCSTHEILCQPRCIGQIDVEPPKAPKYTVETVELRLPSPRPANYEKYSKELTDLTESLIARLAECTQTTVPV
ncbi:unnamed protein product [Caenorhabditis brenneri]